MEEKLRLLPFGCFDAKENMAIDEAIFQLYISPTLRFYKFSDDIVSIGYFQKRQEYKFIRRMTGGFAMKHNKNKEFSFCFVYKLNGLTPLQLQYNVHNRFKAVLENFGFSVDIIKNCSKEPSDFFCFNILSCNDLILGSKKILGSAFKIKFDKILLQGSMDITFIKDLDIFLDKIARGISELNGLKLFYGTLTDAEISLKEKLEIKYGSSEWNNKY